ncbi:MAG TPA: RDD family protein, partial [Blastocatellia bacterium]|nr:RDD family protein [Blastocatellia bacterium]
RMAPDPKMPETRKEQAPAPPSAPRASEQIIEAALLRARRASENASRAILSSDSTPRPKRSAPKATLAVDLAVDKDATAKAIEVAEETKPRSEALNSPAQTPADLSLNALPVAAPIDEIEPVDYLSAEIKKVDQEFGERFAHNESPALFVHVVLNVADFLTIALSAAPFLALIEIYNGNFFERPTRIAAASVIALIAFFYLALTQCLCGKTFGMMLTNTRLVDASTFESPSPQRALVRSAAYFFAALPALIGIIWLLFNRKRRGWHDYISGTMIARDF